MYEVLAAGKAASQGRQSVLLKVSESCLKDSWLWSNLLLDDVLGLAMVLHQELEWNCQGAGQY